MPKGDGSPRNVFLGTDWLEERRLLSHAAGSAIVHSLSGATNPTAPTPILSKPEVESGHTASSASIADDLQERDAEQVAAAAAAQSASTTSLNGRYSIPLVFSPRGISEPEETSVNPTVTLASSRTLRIFYGDDHVAWSLAGSNSLKLTTMSRNWPELTPQVPEASLEERNGLAPRVAQDHQGDVAPETLELLATKEADLLAPYLPIDRAVLEQAIDRLIDGIEVLGERIVSEGETADLIPLPITWALALTGFEVVRRRLRLKRAAGERDDHLEGDPSLGLLGFPS